MIVAAGVPGAAAGGSSSEAPAIPILLVQETAQLLSPGSTGDWGPLNFPAPLTPGSTVLVEVTVWPSNVDNVEAFTVDGEPAVFVSNVQSPDAGGNGTLTYRLNVPLGGAGVVRFKTFSWSDGAIRAREYSGIDPIDPIAFVHVNAAPGYSVDYPEQDVAGCLVLTTSCNLSSAGPGFWVAPSGYSLSLDFANSAAASSGASAYKVLADAAGATVTWLPVALEEAFTAVAVFRPVAA